MKVTQRGSRSRGAPVLDWIGASLAPEVGGRGSGARSTSKRTSGWGTAGCVGVGCGRSAWRGETAGQELDQGCLPWVAPRCARATAEVF